MPDVDLAYAFGLKPEAAIQYFESKGFKITWDWHEMLDDAHARAFTVAKVMQTDILQDIRNEVQRGLTEGITFAEFQKNLTPKLKAKGWWGEVVNEQTGEVAVVGPHRLRTIFDTNIQSAYMAGHYKEAMANVADRPWWMYVAVMDQRTRPAHAAMNGLVFRYDDPFWKTHHPPNGFRCRCSVRYLDDAGLAEKTKAGTAALRSTVGDNASATLADGAVQLNKAGKMAPVTTLKTRDLLGRELTMTTDPGWDYNPGAAGAGKLAVDKVLSWPATDGARVFKEIGAVGAVAVWQGYSAWLAEVRVFGKTRHTTTTLGVMAVEDVEFLSAKGKPLSTAAITIEDRLVVGKKAKRHETKGDALTDAEWDVLPNAVIKPEAVLYDNDSGKILYVMPSLTDPRKIKVVVEPEAVGRGREISNEARTVFKVGANALLDTKKYTVVRGKIE